jgi:hypothetical protein
MMTGCLPAPRVVTSASSSGVSRHTSAEERSDDISSEPRAWILR